MDLRTRLGGALKDAMKAKEADRLSTLRLINAAIKDRDISLRGEGREDGVTDAEVLQILGKMVKQRQESARAYEEGGRLELAEKERAEVTVIEEFLPRQLSEAEVSAAVDKAIAATGAEGIRDMGKVMGELKARYTGQMDFGAVGPMVKDGTAADSRNSRAPIAFLTLPAQSKAQQRSAGRPDGQGGETLRPEDASVRVDERGGARKDGLGRMDLPDRLSRGPRRPARIADAA
jgi:uncharacterized protein